MPLLGEANPVALLFEGGDTPVPLAASIRRIAHFGFADGTVQVVAEVHAGMAADLACLMVDQVPTILGEGLTAAPAIVGIHPLLGAVLTGGEVVQHYAAAVRVYGPLTALGVKCGNGKNDEKSEYCGEPELRHGVPKVPNFGPVDVLNRRSPLYLRTIMTLSRNKNEQPVITLDKELKPSSMRRLTDYIRYLELTDGAKKVTQKQVDAIADSITASYWKKNKKRFLSADHR